MPTLASQRRSNLHYNQRARHLTDLGALTHADFNDATVIADTASKPLTARATQSASNHQTP